MEQISIEIALKHLIYDFFERRKLSESQQSESEENICREQRKKNWSGHTH